MSAESKRVRPASRQTSMSREASATSLAPHALKNSLPPPNVPVPRLNTGTLKPEPPSCRYSMSAFPLLDRGDSLYSRRDHDGNDLLHRRHYHHAGLGHLAGV